MSPAALPNLHDALLLHRQGRLAEAAQGYQNVLRADPANVDALNLLGLVQRHSGDYQEAIRLFKRCLKIKPDFAQAHGHLGDALIETKSFAEAIAALRRAVALAPQWPEAHSNLGYALHESRQFDAAQASYQRALSLQPGAAPVYNHLGNTFLELDRFSEAEQSFRRAIELSPDFVAAHHNLGLLLAGDGRFDEAQVCFRRAIELDADYPPAYGGLATALLQQGRIVEAETYSRKALALVPHFVGAHKTLADALCAQGRYNDAESHYTEALRINPNNFEAHSSLLFFYCYRGQGSSPRALEVAQQCSRLVTKHASRRQFKRWSVNPAPERLRVGLVSGDLKSHPVGHFLESVLSHIDRERIELVAYTTVRYEDDLTQRIKPVFSRWTPIRALGYVNAAQAIHRDGVHILLDLSGHTDFSQLPLFGWRPAPVQTSWLGYFATTGIEQMDYLLADPVSVPPELRGQFTEEVWNLPETRLCFTAPQSDLAVSPLPAQSRGDVTFGCFQNPSKINDDVLKLWSQVLARLPTARLRLQAKLFGDPRFAEHFTQRCVAQGIDAQRLLIHADSPREQYLAAHGEVDIILDTFPYPGGTTTCEALWMGVPTLTLAGGTMIARQGASLLTAAGLPEWIARNEAEYVDKAVAFAGDLAHLAQLRSELRQKVLASPLFDAPRFARHLEDALWGMWRAKGAPRVGAPKH